MSLFDCGGGVTSSFLRRGLYPLDLDRIFISHTHPDHVCEIPLMIQMVYLAGRTDPLQLFVPEEFAEPLTRYLPALYLFKEKLPFELEISGYGPGLVYERDFSVTAHANQHLVGNKEVVMEHGYPNRMQSHSFTVTMGGTRWLYSGDLGSFEDIRGCLEGVELALIESTHIDFDEFLRIAPTLGIGKIVLTHLADAESVRTIEARVRQAKVYNIVFAADGLVLDI